MKLSYKHIIAIIYTIVLFLDRLDLTIVNITLPTVAKYFQVPMVTTDWISLAFLLALAIAIPISAWLGDRFGLKKVYVFAIILFGLSSTLCALADSLSMLIILRFIQGIGGGLLIPVGMTMIYRVYDKTEYASITSFTFIPSLIAPAIAPLLGGLLLEYLGWRTVFLFSGPICLLLAVFAGLYLKEQPHQAKYPLDWLGFGLAAGILLDAFYSLSLLSRVGLSAQSIYGLLVLVLLIVAFILQERRATHPLINLDFFNHSTFVKANLLQLCFQVCHFGAIFLIGMYLQIGVGFSAVVAGLMMGMQALGAITVSRYSVKLFNDYGGKRPIMIGLAGIALLSPMILFIDKPGAMMAGLLLFYVRGLFSGLCGTPIQTLSVIDFPKAQISAVNGVFNACRQVAISLGVAISSTLIAYGLQTQALTNAFAMSKAQAFAVFHYGFIAISLVAVIGVGISYTLNRATQLC